MVSSRTIQALVAAVLAVAASRLYHPEMSMLDNFTSRLLYFMQTMVLNTHTLTYPEDADAFIKIREAAAMQQEFVRHWHLINPAPAEAAKYVDENCTREEKLIDGPNGPIPIVVLAPRRELSESKLPLLLQIHGGGMVVGSAEEGLFRKR